MNTVARLSAYGAAAVLLGAGAFATGSAVDVPTAHLQPAPSGAAGNAGGYSAPAIADINSPAHSEGGHQ